MTTTGSPVSHANDCARFEAQLGAWLEHDLDTSEQGWMTAHRHRCATCATLVAELESVIADAGALPVLSPPRDLWSGIESRLEAPVIPIPTATRVASPRRRTITVRWFAAAATLLVAVSSAITWQFARRGVDVGTGSDRLVTMAGIDAPASRDIPVVDSMPAPAVPVATPALASAGSPTATPQRRAAVSQVAHDEADLLDVDVTYEREISALRQIVDERFAELDSSTVTVLRRNLEIIDMAITDSRAALQRDPRSAVVSSQLDRALQAKLSLLRRVALL